LTYCYIMLLLFPKHLVVFSKREKDKGREEAEEASTIVSTFYKKDQHK